MSRKLIVSLLGLFIFTCVVAQAGAQECAPPGLIPDAKSNNIFSPEQEMILGDLTYQRLSGEQRFIKDPVLLAYVNDIGNRLVSHLPPTNLKFRFFIVDLPEANAFNIPGGYVFLSRKLIALTNNEAELAGVIAHELGHAVVRHAASNVSERLRKILNVTKVGDHRDIAEKYNLLIERRRTKTIVRPPDHESDQQIQADSVGLFAMVSAGYDPNAFAEFYGRLAEAKASSGNWFGDIFGVPSPDQQRIRKMIKIAESIPAKCRESLQANVTKSFIKWQADVVSYRETNRSVKLDGLLWKRDLTTRLRSDIFHFAFSSDGERFLAQDDFGITVIQRAPLKVVFQIPVAPLAHDASFSPDGQFVVYGTQNLRFEKWSIADRKPVAVREFVVRGGCWDYEFSPDGKYLACVHIGDNVRQTTWENKLGANIRILETETGKLAWEKKDFYWLSRFEFEEWLIEKETKDRKTKEGAFFHFEFSPDGRILVVSRSTEYRYALGVGLWVDKSRDALYAMDLENLKPISTGGDLSLLTRYPFAFLDSDRIVVMPPRKRENGGIFSFPDGKRLEDFVIEGIEIKSTRNPNYVVVKPLAKSKMGIVNASEGTLAAGLDKADATIWKDFMVYESVSGTVLLSKITYDPSKKILQIDSKESLEIPPGPVSNLEAVEVSDNFQWLAVSSKTRGAIWDLTSGARRMDLRGFKGALLADNGSGISDFPKVDSDLHHLATLNPKTNSSESLMELPDIGAQQHRQFVLVRQSLKTPKSGKPTEVPAGTEETFLSQAVRFQLLNLVENKLAWTREFPKTAPLFFFDELSGRLILYWRLGSESGKARLKDDPVLARRATEFGNKDDDYFVEIVDGFSGKTVGSLLIETGLASFGIESGFSDLDWLVLQDNENRLLAYSIKEGKLVQRFFGSKAALNPQKNLIVVENYPGELTLYDLNTGDPLNRLVIEGQTAFLKFALDGRRLFVLSSEQTAYAFDVNKLAVDSVR